MVRSLCPVVGCGQHGADRCRCPPGTPGALNAKRLAKEAAAEATAAANTAASTTAAPATAAANTAASTTAAPITPAPTTAASTTATVPEQKRQRTEGTFVRVKAEVAAKVETPNLDEVD